MKDSPDEIRALAERLEALRPFVARALGGSNLADAARLLLVRVLGGSDLADAARLLRLRAQEVKAGLQCEDRWEAQCLRDYGPKPTELVARLRWWIPLDARHGKTALETDLAEAAERIADHLK